MIHRVPLWAFGPVIFLSGLFYATEPGDEGLRKVMMVGGVILMILFTFPYLRESGNDLLDSLKKDTEAESSNR